MSMRRPFIRCKAILFDLDGVLVDSSRCVELVWRAWAAGHGIDAEAIMRVAHGRRTGETLALIAPHLNSGTETTVLDRMAENEHGGEGAFPGVPEFVAGLPVGRWAIVTSGMEPVVGRRIRVAGVPRPEVLVTARDVRQGKPAPEGYLTAATRLGFSPNECLVIEDAPVGVAAGKAAGMQVIAVLTTHLKEQLAGAAMTISSAGCLAATYHDDGWIEVYEKES